MSTTIFWHPHIFLHDRNAWHQTMLPDRIETIHAAASVVPGITQVLATPVPLEQLELVHTSEYVRDLQQNAPKTLGETYAFDPETRMNFYTLEALRLSVGAVCQAIDAVHSGRTTNAFCPVYAGHHAVPARAMGFCIVNATAIGAKHAASLGYPRIAVADFDTHSGNGTLVALQHDPQFLFVETYQPGFPGRFISRYNVPPNILQVETATGPVGRQSWRDSWEYTLLPALAKFQPEILLVSAGFDAHENDPLGMTYLQDEDYSWLTRELVRIQPRIVSVLEGGYSLPDASRCAALHVAELMRGAMEKEKS